MMMQPRRQSSTLGNMAVESDFFDAPSFDYGAYSGGGESFDYEQQPAFDPRINIEAPPPTYYEPNYYEPVYETPAPYIAPPIFENPQTFETQYQAPSAVSYAPERQLVDLPVYQEPIYQQPIYEPVYQEPIYQQPIYQEPIYQPSYTAPAEAPQQAAIEFVAEAAPVASAIAESSDAGSSQQSVSIATAETIAQEQQAPAIVSQAQADNGSQTPTTETAAPQVTAENNEAAVSTVSTTATAESSDAGSTTQTATTQTAANVETTAAANTTTAANTTAATTDAGSSLIAGIDNKFLFIGGGLLILFFLIGD